MPSVIGHVEYHLLHNTKIGNEKLMWMADAYGMKQLLEKTVRETTTVEKAKLSKDPKTIVLDHILLYSIISFLLISFVIVVDCFVELKFKTL
ncbi:hypothetical protein GCK72_007461 [Caenorhabditis remanei]|uniref:Uncharacterized protein n=1 Tax=Caenorhabditis remanei TaxID=31234 RepID=A0A6A5HNX7_CAERE|nr:hypothetical protein GCK72_007459 [Caenorhabditis remanei]XP_053590416.1 hypothetical protein GCK72_007461 [Caenorhabditis remanei]KAF1767500.1 hypothetical protein GCK72_007459 [Caenorhabditis remanei]KAF1767502.1 hypothetical protein GCK72_007461 [Caenorhabditis remanei]